MSCLSLKYVQKLNNKQNKKNTHTHTNQKKKPTIRTKKKLLENICRVQQFVTEVQYLQKKLKKKPTFFYACKSAEIGYFSTAVTILKHQSTNLLVSVNITVCKLVLCFMCILETFKLVSYALIVYNIQVTLNTLLSSIQLSFKNAQFD